MRKFTQLVAIGIIVLCSVSISNAQNKGPVLTDKLELPEKINTQHIQDSSRIWIRGQWKVENNKYIWVSGHWENKKVGYVFVNGKWKRKFTGWVWTEGYWKKVDLTKWIHLYG